MFSGTTACLLYIENETIYCANLGDSRAVLYSQKKKWESKPLSIDHKGESEKEAERIVKNGGRVFPYLDEDG